MSLDYAIWTADIAAEAVLLGVLLYRRTWRSFPAFSLYSLWSLASDIGTMLIYRRFPSLYAIAYLTAIAVGSLLEFGVLVELAWSVFRPYRSLLPRATPFVLAGTVLLIGAAIWPLTDLSGTFHTSLQYSLFVHLRQDSAILRVFLFLALAGCSQLLSIGWRDRELQIATGLGFFSLVDLAFEMVLSHIALGPAYIHLNRIVILSFTCSLFYWIYSLARKEPERRPFTPQMQSFLLAVAGSARSARLALSGSGQTQKP